MLIVLYRNILEYMRYSGKDIKKRCNDYIVLYRNILKYMQYSDNPLPRMKKILKPVVIADVVSLSSVSTYSGIGTN